jgi:DNA repair exonuclease SbcCD nuclease subunit
MRRTLGTTLLLACLTVPATARTKPSITVGIVGDQTFNSDLNRSYSILEQGVGILSARRPDVVLHVGDLVESTGTPEEIRASFQKAAAILDRLPVPWHLTAGDHDVNPPGWQAASTDRSREALFQELYGAREPAFRERPWYSFDVKGFHFIALYSHQVLRVDPRWGDIFLARIQDDQLAWLQRDLESHRRARAVIVFLHQPLWYHWSGWKRVHDLLRRYPVAAVVAGHFHYDQDEGEIDGIRYLVVGTTGGDTKHGSRDAGEAHHVTLLRVEGPRKVQIDLVPVPPVTGGEPLKLTPREDMDRVQVLDVQLGNLWNFTERNPVFLKNGQLVADCQSGAPARIRIDSLGNPIDLPVDVEVDFRSEGVTLDQPGFGSGLCQAGSGPRTCRLAPAAQTNASNYSSVDVQSGVSVWESGLKSEAPAPGTVLAFDIRTSFTGLSGKLYVEKTVQTTVRACP